MQTYPEWVAAVRARGAMAVTRISGAGGTQLIVAKFVAPDGTVIYERAPIHLQLADAATIAQERVWLAAGQAVAVRDAILSGLKPGAVGLASAITGIPPWAIIGGGVVIGYAMLANAGLVPPVNKLFRG